MSEIEQTVAGTISHKDFAAHVEAILKGDEALPNAKVEEDLGRFLGNLAAGGHSMKPEWGWSKLPSGAPNQTRKNWTQFFLKNESNMSAGGSPTSGEGYAVRYENGKGVVYSWAICRHQKVDGAGANHSHGWHPGRCSICGIDMTIDSGD